MTQKKLRIFRTTQSLLNTRARKNCVWFWRNRLTIISMLDLSCSRTSRLSYCDGDKVASLLPLIVKMFRQICVHENDTLVTHPIAHQSRRSDAGLRPYYGYVWYGLRCVPSFAGTSITRSRRGTQLPVGSPDTVGAHVLRDFLSARAIGL